MCVLFRGDRAYGAYVQSLAPMENQLRDAQLVCTVSFFVDLWYGYRESLACCLACRNLHQLFQKIFFFRKEQVEEKTNRCNLLAQVYRVPLPTVLEYLVY